MPDSYAVCMNTLTRRQAVKVLALLPALPLPTALAMEAGSGSGEVSYRVDATVLFCGVPLLTRSGVGDGFAAVRARGKSHSIRFGAGSWPERAAGLNRFGLIREEIELRADGSEAIEFRGIVTANKEESFQDARSALHSQASTSLTAVYGAIKDGVVTSALRRFPAPDGCQWLDPGAVERTLDSAQSTEFAERQAGKGQITFLEAMRKAGQHEGSTTLEFVHLARPYVLETRRQGTKLDGVIRNSSGKVTAEFRTWYDPQTTHGIPIRIEYKAKSYLRLTFNATAGV